MTKNAELAVASYNLGIGGAKTWDKLGRPNVWTPSYVTKPRDTRLYIDRIVKQAKNDGLV